MATIPGVREPPTLAEIETIVGIPDPIVRNLRITQCYHELTTALSERLGSGANWCAFATWASRQAGRTIRGEDLTDAIEAELARSAVLRAMLLTVAERARALGANRDVEEIEKVVTDLLDLRGAAARAGEAVARGNLKVFAEIGRAFAAFLQSTAGITEPDPVALSLFTGGLREGDPPAGQRLLREAFANYYRAMFEPDPGQRAELLLLANLQVGFHEQTRLQPEIAAALDVAIPDADQVTSRLISAVFPRHAALLIRARRLYGRILGGPTPLDRAARSLVEFTRREVRLLLTEQIMTLALPGGTRLRLGRDLTSTYPESLRALRNPDLLALLKLADPTPDSTLGSGATDWADLAQRMHFIADLFRCYHESPELLDPPFSADQLRILRAGERPPAPL